jgi:hypothetical protein
VALLVLARVGQQTPVAVARSNRRDCLALPWQSHLATVVSLPPEILLAIIEASEFIPELLTYRNIFRHFRKLVDDKCQRFAFQLARQHIDAFDDALLTMRVMLPP